MKLGGEDIVAPDKSKLIPAAFWVGFLALGFVTSVGAPNKHRVIDRAAAGPARTVAAPVFAQTEPWNASLGAKPAKY